MTEHMDPHLPGRPIERRIKRKGFRPRYAAYLIIASWSVGVVIFGVVEWLVDRGTFHTVWLAMWWAIQTVTTVGYGDVVPGSTAGKVIGSLLMLGGLALFAVVTGAITSAFVAERQREGMVAGEDPVMQRLDDLSSRLDAMKAEIARLDRRGS